MRVVLETNVLVSGLLTPFSPPGAIVRMVVAGVLALCVDARVLSEYDEVLRRPQFDFDEDAVAALMDYIEAASDTVATPPITPRLPDPDDEVFLEVTATSAAEHLITGNLGHFSERLRAGVSGCVATRVRRALPPDLCVPSQLRGAPVYLEATLTSCFVLPLIGFTVRRSRYDCLGGGPWSIYSRASTST